MSAIRKQVTYRGHVQGVGFRFTVRRLAARLSLTGYVRNLPNGCVELVAEGDTAVLRELLRDIATKMREHITNVDITDTAATGEFDAFGVRF